LEQAKADSMATATIPKKIVIEKTDTVFITKYITEPASSSAESLVVENEDEISNNENSPVTDEANKGEEINSEIPDNKLVTKKSSKENVSKKFFENEKTDSPIIKLEGKNFDKVNKKNGKAFVKTNSKSLNNTNTHKQNSEVVSTISTNAVSSEIPISISNSVAEKVENRKLNFDYLSPKSYHSDVNKVILGLSNRNFALPKLAAKNSDKKTFKLPNISLPNLKYRVGLGVEMAHEHGELNVLTDILVSKRWSVTTGIGLSTFFDDKDFDNEDEFRRSTKKDFREEYESRINDNTQINDIRINEALLKIPLYINYRLPLPHNFTVLFTTGSNFDIYSRQFISYNNQGSFRDNDHNRFSLKGNTTPFNNLLFSTGIEKRWKKYSVQISPYFTTQIQPIAYQKDDWQVGLKLNGFYRISR